MSVCDISAEQLLHLNRNSTPNVIQSQAVNVKIVNTTYKVRF